MRERKPTPASRWLPAAIMLMGFTALEAAGLGGCALDEEEELVSSEPSTVAASGAGVTVDMSANSTRSGGRPAG